MAFSKKILKNDHREVIIKFVGTGSETITLSSLVSPGRQTVTGTPKVHIVSLSVSIATDQEFLITRNGEETFHIHGDYDFQSDGIVHAVANENETSDIVISTVSTGTIIIRLRKVDGYSAPFAGEAQL